MFNFCLQVSAPVCLGARERINYIRHLAGMLGSDGKPWAGVTGAGLGRWYCALVRWIQHYTGRATRHIFVGKTLLTQFGC